MRVHQAKAGRFQFENMGAYPYGAMVYYHEGKQVIVVTMGVFRTKERAVDWAKAALKLYNTLPQADAELQEPPDDYDMREGQQ